MIFLLDTDVVIDWLEARLSQDVKESLEQSQLGVSTVTLMEVAEGARPGDDAALARLNSLIAQMSILPFEIESAFIAARIRRELRLSGKQIGLRSLDIQSRPLR